MQQYTALSCCRRSWAIRWVLQNSLPVVSLNDGRVDVCQLVSVDRRWCVQVLLLNITIGLLVAQDQVDLQMYIDINYMLLLN